ncbi:hypothetical protein FRC05_011008 [Tulasnella sp. 425]|nr:hypothetical protein FRC05_011008 [Tulasnella sp. 425]
MSNLTAYGLDSATVENVGAYISNVRVTHLATLATASFLVYDVFLTFDDEFDYIWRSRLSYAKAIFLLNRYLTLILFGYDLFVLFAVPKSPNVSLTAFLMVENPRLIQNLTVIHGQLAAPASMPNMFFVSTIFMMRTYALYERSRLSLAILVVTYVLCFAPSFIYFYIMAERGLGAEAWRTINDLIKIKEVLAANGVDLTQGWWVITTCANVVPAELGAIMVSALVYETTLIGAAVGCYYNTTSRAFVASRYFVGMKSVLCSRMILRLRWYSGSTEAQSPTFGGQEEALVTGTDIFFAEADPNSKDAWMKNEDFGIEVPPGSVFSRGVSGEDYEAMAMVPVRTRVVSGGSEDLDLEVGSSFNEDCREDAGGEEEETSTPSTSLGAETSQTDLSIRREDVIAGPSRSSDQASSLPPEG